MDPFDIREHLRRRPFRPFRVFLSDGSSYDGDPHAAFISERELLIGINPDEEGVPERSVHCRPVDVTAIGPLDAA